MAKVKELFKISKGKKEEETDTESGNAVRYIQIEDLRNDDNLKYCIPQKNSVFVDEKDLIIAWDGANAGTIGVGLIGAIGSTLAKLELKNPNVNSYYAAKFMQTKFQYLRERCTGATIPHISKSALEDLIIPLPPLETQKKIVEALDKAQSLVDARKEQIRLMDELVKSRFIEMFGDPVINSKRYLKKTLIEECEIITGNTPSRQKPQFYGNCIEWIKSDNINTPSAYLTKASEYLSSEGLKVGRYVEAGSILMTCIAGSLSCIGNIAIADRRVSFNQQINAIVPKKNNLWFIYVQLMLSKTYIQSTINMALKGILSKGQLSELKFIFPPLEQQNEFGDFVEKIEKTKLVIQSSLDEMGETYGALVQQYFR